MSEQFVKTTRPWWVYPVSALVLFLVIAYQNCADYQMTTATDAAQTSSSSAE